MYGVCAKSVSTTKKPNRLWVSHTCATIYKPTPNHLQVCSRPSAFGLPETPTFAKWVNNNNKKTIDSTINKLCALCCVHEREWTVILLAHIHSNTHLHDDNQQIFTYRVQSRDIWYILFVLVMFLVELTSSEVTNSKLVICYCHKPTQHS